MLKEIKTAVDFICTMLARKVDVVVLDTFREALEGNLEVRYADHWFPEKPFKGSAFRCLRVVRGDMDKDITKAWQSCSVSSDKSDLVSLLPNELTLWVDPNEVSYRFGEEGSIGVLCTTEADEISQSSDSDSTDSSMSCSESSDVSFDASFQQVFPQMFHAMPVVASPQSQRVVTIYG